MQTLVFCDNADLQPTISLCHKYKRGIEIQSFYDPQLLQHIPDAVEKHRQALESLIPVVTWVETLRTHIGYVHLHDNHGESDEHLGLGLGTIPLDEVCQALQHYAPTAVWALETQVSDIESSLRWLEEHDFLDCVPPQPVSFSDCVCGEK